MEYKIVVDAGHGGSDPGASGNGIVEKDYTLKISQYIHDRLDDLGIENTLVRNSDATLEPSARVDKILDAYGNGNDVIVVSNHINAGGGDGAEVIYALRNNDSLSKKIANELETEGQNVRKYYQRRLPSDPSKDYYFIMRDTPNTQAIIVEYGFLDSTGDDVNQLKNNWEKYAEAVVRALASYVGAKYVPLAGSGYYVVKKGDSLWSIAKANGTSVEAIKELNNLTNNMLSVGQTLKIPGSEEVQEPTGEYTNYEVKAGDSLYSIANKYGVTVNELINYNKLSSTLLQVGQIIKIPNIISNTYEVKAGDTLYGIANKYGISVDELKKANNLSSSNLSIGQKLIIPSIETENSGYVVVAGDNLYKWQQ